MNVSYNILNKAEHRGGGGIIIIIILTRETSTLNRWIIIIKTKNHNGIQLFKIVCQVCHNIFSYAPWKTYPRYIVNVLFSPERLWHYIFVSYYHSIKLFVSVSIYYYFHTKTKNNGTPKISSNNLYLRSVIII